MKTLIKFRTTTSRLFVLFALGGLVLSPKVSASGGPPSNCNTSEGYQALFNVTTGFDDTAFGGRALYSDTSGSDNTAVGCGALVGNTTGNHNTATGSQALSRNTGGDENTANGYRALYNNTGGGNTASGVEALLSNTIGYYNTATGFQALQSNTVGVRNTATGVGALEFNTTGRDNTAIGDGALPHSTGEGNTALGAGAGFLVTTANNVICIGADFGGANVSNSCFIGNIRFVTTANDDAIPVVIDSAGQLGNASSSARFKTEIKPMDEASEAVLALTPVTFHYKNSSKATLQFGLIAEEVAKVNPDLVVRDKNGDIYTVRYDAVNAMLLNEFLKEHRKVEKLEATVAQQRNDFQSAFAQQQQSFQSRLAEQEQQIEALASGLQKVSAQLELDKLAPRTVLNKP